jgi:hypothetical protein
MCGRELKIPNNLYIIAAANAVDRSVSNLDRALQERFWLMDVDSGTEQHVLLRRWCRKQRLDDSVCEIACKSLETSTSVSAPD